MDEARKERRLKRGNRALRFRGLKNFLFWLTGVVSGFIIIAGLIFLAVYVLPTKTILGYGGISDTGEYVSDEIAEKSIVKALLGFSDYSVGDIPFIEKTLKDVVSSSGLENYITLDYEKLSSVKFSGNGGSNFAGELQSCLTVTATIESIGGKGMLGDLANLPVFSWEEAVADPLSENFEPRLYYYMASGDSVENAVFERAFTDEGEYVDGVDASTTTYLASLDKISVAEVKDILSARFGTVKIASLISAFGGAGEGETINKIFKDTTISGLNSFTFDDVDLADVLKEDDNQQLFKILRSAAGLGAGEPITIGSLSAIDFDNVNLSEVIKEADNQQLFKILRSAAGLDAGVPVKLGNLSGINAGNILIADVLGKDEHGEQKGQSLLDILCGAVSGATAETLSVGDLANLDVNNIRLADVLGKDELRAQKGEALLKILCGAVSGKTKETLSVGDLVTLDVNNIRIADVLGKDELGAQKGEALLKILCGAVSGKTKETLSVGDLVTLDVNYIRLADILDPADNAKLYNILLDASGKMSVDDVTVGSISGSSFNIDNIKLSTVLDRTSVAVTDNLVLKSLLYNPDGTPNDDVTIGNIAEKMNNKKISEIFNVTCFVEVGEGNTKATYDKIISDGKEVYTRNDAGTGQYRIADKGVWLFMLYDESGSRDDFGNAGIYTESGTTFSGLNGRVSGVDNNIINASIRQLVDAGILSDNSSYSLIYTKSISDVLSSYSGSGS